MSFDSPATADTTLDERLRAWFRDELGMDEYRRAARVDERTILASKLPPGVVGRIHEVVDALDVLFDADAVAAAYFREVAAAATGTGRATAWHAAMTRLLGETGAAKGIRAEERNLIQPGIDSVGAMLDAVLWTRPAVDDAYEPCPGERDAYLDATARLGEGRDTFTRVFGVFEDRDVMNVCPGAPFARTMLAQAWLACTGTPPPERPPDA